jgi:signal transduction histidine kinase
LNLLNNAVEAMSGASKSGRPGGMTGGEIKIRTLPGKGNIVITVADTGPGIAEKDLHHVFDAFYTRKKKMGMGVGLSICHGFVEDHGGTIAAENSPEGGAVFTIKLPLGIVDC